MINMFAFSQSSIIYNVCCILNMCVTIKLQLHSYYLIYKYLYLMALKKVNICPFLLFKFNYFRKKKCCS